MEVFIARFIVFPYLVLVHVGMLVWLISAISAVVKKSIAIEIDVAKIIGALYGGIVGVLIPYFDLTFSHPTEAWGAAFANIPALFVGHYIMIQENIYASTLWPHHWEYYIPFAIFGLIGGWGIGQFIDWIAGLRGQKHLI